MKYPKGIKGKLDKIFSKCVRERADWFCEYSGKYFPEGHRQGLHCSHFHGRRNLTLRWHPDNCFAHSYSAHSYLGDNPSEFVAWALEKLGEGRMEMLRERKRDIRIRYRTKDFNDMYRHYVTELEAMNQKRADGVEGRIEFMAYD